MTDLKFGVCGNLDWHGTPDELNPISTLKRNDVGELLLKLNREPMGKSDLIDEYGDLEEEIEKLLRLGALREDDLVYVNFTFIDEEDSDHVFRESEPFARRLCESIMENKGTLYETLDRYDNPEVSKEKLAFFIIGCYLLDWGALEMFRNWEVSNNLKSQPGGNEYTLWGEEEVDQLLKRVYWGGHALKSGEYIFHTFGDHHGYKMRNAFPDIINSFPDLDFEGRNEYRTLLLEKKKELLEELGDVIHGAFDNREISKDRRGHIELLKKTGYIREDDDSVVTIPYFFEEHIDMLTDALDPFVPVLESWVKDQLPIFEKKMNDIRPIQNGVPFDEVFIQLWHVVFGLTNRYLAEEGVIYDTYEEGIGYLPGLFKEEVSQEVVEYLTTRS